MRLQMVRVCEVFAAVHANVWLLPRVRPRVGPQVGGGGERFATRLTRIWLLSCVGPGVNVQSVLSAEA